MPTYIFSVSRAAQVDWDAAEFADGETLNIEVQRSAEVTGALFVVFSDTEGGDALVQKAFTGNAVALRADDMTLLAEGGSWFADIVEVDGGDQYRVRKGRVVKLPSIALVSVPDVAPENTVAPAITGTAEVGETLTCSTGTWTGTPTPAYAYQWQRDGSNISGATASTYVLQAADDGADVRCVVTATNAAGSASANSATVAVTYPAPTATGSLADVSITVGDGNVTRDAGALFTGAVGGTWAVTVNGSVNASVATIDSAGVVTVLDDTEISGATIVATYTNSGGSASRGFSATVAAAAGNTLAATITDFSRDENIFDVAQTVPLAGTCDAGADGLVIEARMVESDGTQIHGWQDVATASGTSWSGNFDPPAENDGAWGYFEARVKESTATPDRMTNKSAIGRVVANFVQSDGPLGTYVTDWGTPPNALIPSIPTNGQVQLYNYSATRISVSDATPVSIGIATFARDYLTRNPGKFLTVANHAKGATSQIQLAADDPNRPWSAEVTVANALKTDGVVPSIIMSGWWHGATGLAGDFAKFIAPFYTGKLLDGTDVTSSIEGGSYVISAGGSDRSITHYIRELYPDAAVSKFAFVDHQEGTGGSGPGNLTAAVQGALNTNPDTEAQRQSVNAMATNLSAELIPGIWTTPLDSYQLDPADIVHPEQSIPGIGRQASLTANMFTVLFGYAAGGTPEVNNVTWGAPAITFNSTWGAVTTPRVAESVAALTGYPTRGVVTGLQLNGAPISVRTSIDGSGNVVVSAPPNLTFDGDDVLFLGGGGNSGALSLADDDDSTALSLPVVPFTVAGSNSPYLNIKARESFASTLASPTRYSVTNGTSGDILDSADVATASSLTFEVDVIFGDGDDVGTLFERADGGFEVGGTTLNRLLLRARDTAGTELIGGDLQVLPSIFVTGTRLRLLTTINMTGTSGGTLKVFVEGSEVYTTTLASSHTGNLLVGDTGMGSRGNGFGARGDRSINYIRFAENVYLADGDTTGVTWRFWRNAAGFVENSSVAPS